MYKGGGKQKEGSSKSSFNLPTSLPSPLFTRPTCSLTLTLYKNPPPSPLPSSLPPPPPPAAGAPCGACKFLRRKCVSGCIFAPHFGSDQGAARFAAVHKVFGASNVSKLLLHVPVNRRNEAVVTISYEAQARLSDPVLGCVSTILTLQQQACSPTPILISLASLILSSIISSSLIR
ncbi:unnamed protein product [Linum tenue]|uniref:LOB domain-containing protein n=1 Tax=Linum tenue TaxID=586396 RepID=A0AAV0HK20_9ROSI|nr:unnamed protein product [Linum tenue]